MTKATSPQLNRPLRTEREAELERALKDLADAADDVGVAHFDTDTMDLDVQALQMATQEARTVLEKKP